MPFRWPRLKFCKSIGAQVLKQFYWIGQVATTDGDMEFSLFLEQLSLEIGLCKCGSCELLWIKIPLICVQEMGSTS